MRTLSISSSGRHITIAQPFLLVMRLLLLAAVVCWTAWAASWAWGWWHDYEAVPRYTSAHPELPPLPGAARAHEVLPVEVGGRLLSAGVGHVAGRPPPREPGWTFVVAGGQLRLISIQPSPFFRGPNLSAELPYGATIERSSASGGLTNLLWCTYHYDDFYFNAKSEPSSPNIP